MRDVSCNSLSAHSYGQTGSPFGPARARGLHVEVLPHKLPLLWQPLYSGLVSKVCLCLRTSLLTET